MVGGSLRSTQLTTGYSNLRPTRPSQALFPPTVSQQGVRILLFRFEGAACPLALRPDRVAAWGGGVPSRVCSTRSGGAPSATGPLGTAPPAGAPRARYPAP